MPRSMVLAAFLLLAPGLSAAGCENQASWVQLAAKRSHGRFDEFDANGRRLVRESGSLRGLDAALEFRCDDWRWRGQHGASSGRRDYAGSTSIGVPVASTSDIRQRHRHLEALVDLTTHWALGGRWSRQSIQREIASAGGAAGYPERYEWSVIQLGAQWRMAFGPGELAMAAWTGETGRANMRLWLPGRDPAVLALGRLRQTELTVAWGYPLTPAWHARIELAWRRTTTGRSEPVIITRNGLPTGMAQQPALTMNETPLSIRLGYRF